MFMLVFIRDLGSSLMFFGAFLALIYVATNRLSFVIIGLLCSSRGAWFFARPSDTSGDRIDIWLDPYAPCRRRGLSGAAVDVRPGGRRPVRQRASASRC